MGTAPTRIITYTSEDGRFDKIATVAARTAAAAGATLIYYDIDAAGMMGSPHPTFWSADNETAVARGLLDPKELDTAGRHAVAKCVSRAARPASTRTAGCQIRRAPTRWSISP